MSEKLKNIKSDLKKVDAHRITKEEYDDIPELTDDMFEKATYRVAGIEKPAPRRRGPQKRSLKKPTYIRLSPEVVAYYKSTGKGWQKRIDEALLKSIKKSKQPTKKSA